MHSDSLENAPTLLPMQVAQRGKHAMLVVSGQGDVDAAFADMEHLLLSIEMPASATVAYVLTAAMASSSTVGPVLHTPDPVSVQLVEWCRMATYTLKLCMASLCLLGEAITSGSTTGMSELVSSSFTNLLSRATRCSSLLRSYVTARTKFSTRTQFAQYSDL